MAHYHQYFYATFMASIDAIALSLLKLKHTGAIKHSSVFPITMLIYSIQPLIFYNALFIENMTVLNLLWDVISDLFITCIGLFFFNETINTYQGLGIVFCLFGIVLLGIK